MKAPDKIYTDNRGVYAECPVFSQAGVNVEYIRKDALLEWAKETYLNENASAIRKVCYKQLVDKINSM